MIGAHDNLADFGPDLPVSGFCTRWEIVARHQRELVLGLLHLLGCGTMIVPLVCPHQ